ncbi:MAG: SBBP repeat-containing protein [Bacteroidota bacterium]|nr:SBBP repeat-containing protein [Bacteroidota bacterium]
MRKFIFFIIIYFLLFFFHFSCVSAQTPDWIWAKSEVENINCYPKSIAVDASGNTYVAGIFLNKIKFGSTTLKSISGSNDIFIVKYDTNGNLLWAKREGGTDDDYVSSVAVDVSGNIYVAGSFVSSIITFGSTTLTNTNVGNNDFFLAKYDSNGNVLWAKNAEGYSAASSVAVDVSGNAYLAGRFYCHTLKIGSIFLTNVDSNYTYDIFVAKYDANGNVLWAKSAGGNGADYVNSIAVDALGNTYITGIFDSTSTKVNFGSIKLINSGNRDIFVAKYDANGNTLWAKSVAGVKTRSDNESNSIAVDATGNIYIAGTFYSSTITFGTTTLKNSGWANIFLVKYDAYGSVIWAKTAEGINFGVAYAYSVAVDNSGDAYITGNYSSITFDSITLSDRGLLNSFITKYDANGNVLWAKSLDNNAYVDVETIAVDASENAYIAGYFQSYSLIFGSITLANPNGDDFFIAKLGSGKTTCMVNAGPDKTINSGYPVSLTATGGNVYSWSTGAKTASINVNPTSSATYTVTGTTNGCSASDNVVVKVNPPIIASAGPDLTICYLDTPRITATGGKFYHWSTGSRMQSIVVNPTTTTTYIVTVTSATGQTAKASVKVTVNAATVNIGPDRTVCKGDSVTLTAVGTGSFQWNTGATTASIIVRPQMMKIYSVTATNNNCTAKDYVVIKVLRTNAFAGYDKTICKGKSTNLTAFGGASYQWTMDNGQLKMGQVISVSPTVRTTYVVTVTSNRGCKATDDIVVSVTNCKDNDIKPSPPTPLPQERGVNLSVYPNPNNGEFVVEINGVKDEVVDLKVMDVMGKVVESEKIKVKSDGMIKFDLSGFENGVYFINLTPDASNKGDGSLQRIVKKVVLMK